MKSNKTKAIKKDKGSKVLVKRNESEESEEEKDEIVHKTQSEKDFHVEIIASLGPDTP